MTASSKTSVPTTSSSRQAEDTFEFNRLFAWGWNNKQLMKKSNEEYLLVPEEVTSFNWSTVKSFSVGGCHGAFITSDDRVFTFGRNQSGQLGTGDTLDREVPVELTSQVFHNERIKHVACGDRHTVFVTLSGRLYSCGHNYNSQLGNGSNGNVYIPTLVDNLKSKKIEKVYCGSRHTIAVTERGEMYSAGYGYYGQLGHGDNLDQTYFKKINVEWKVRSISCREHLNVCLTEDYSVYQWGGKGPDDNDASDNNEPRFLFKNLNGRRVIEVAASSKHCVCITSDGSLYAWGFSLTNTGYQKFLKNIEHTKLNENRKLIEFEEELTRQKLDLSCKYIVRDHPFILYKNHFLTNDKVVSIACSTSANYCVTQGGQMYVFGACVNGELGVGSKEAKVEYPSIVPFPNNSKAVRVVAGNFHAFALATE